MNYIFVGEKRSENAIKHGYTWQHGKSTAKFLFDALRTVGIDPGEQFFCNLYFDDGTLDGTMVEYLTGTDLKVVGMGKKVQKTLEDYLIPYIGIVHPAARGKYKQRETYALHLRERLGIT
jgi:hypothetical protein